MTKQQKILIVEDDPFLSKLMNRYLQEEGLEIEMVRNGAEALEKIEKGGIQLILLDLIMPVKDGFAVLEELKKKKSKIPVLVFTNLAQEEDREAVMALGAKGYYVKHNVTIDDMVKIIKTYI